MLTDLDRRILRYLQADPGAPLVDLAARVGVAPPRLTRRLERLQDLGLYQGQTVRIDWAKLGYEVEVSLRVRLDKTAPRAFDAFLAAAREIPEVIALQTFLGVVDVRLSVVARDMADYQRLYRERILDLPHIADIEALMHVATLKAEEILPL